MHLDVSTHSFSRVRTTPADLRKASKHLYYELMMLTGLAHAQGIRTFESVIQNAVIESFTIHARVLLHFLFSGKASQPDDVLAEDFFPEPKRWLEVRGDMPAPLQEVSRRVGKEIAH